MINSNNIYATVFNVEDKGNYVKARISTSRKDQNGEYVNSYWNAMFLGKCVSEAKGLKDKDRIHITSAGVANESFKDSEGNNRYYTNVKVFDFENNNNKDSKPSSNSSKPAKSSKKPKKKAEEANDDDVPF